MQSELSAIYICAYMADNKLSKFIRGTCGPLMRKREYAKRLGANCDTREILQSFFRSQLNANEWSPQIAIGIADWAFHWIYWHAPTLDCWNCCCCCSCHCTMGKNVKLKDFHICYVASYFINGLIWLFRILRRTQKPFIEF